MNIFLKQNVSFLVVIALIIVSPVAARAENSKKSVESLTDLIDEAIAANDHIAAAHSKWKAAEYNIKYVKGMPDPQAQYGYFFDNVETRVGPQEHRYNISQKIPFLGKLITQGKIQAKQAEALQAEYEATKREMIKKMKMLYYDMYWIEKAVQITEQEKNVVAAVENVAEKKYETNQVPQQDVMRAQLELSRLLDKLLQFKQNRKTLEAKMNNLLERALGSSIAIEENIELPLFEYDLDNLRILGRQSKQELLAAKVAVEKAEFEKTLATLNYIPDVTVGFDYVQVDSGHTTMPNDGADAYAGTVAVNIPLWFGKLHAKVQEKKELLNARVKDTKDVEDDIMYEIEDLYYKIITYKNIIALYQSALIPQSNQAVEAARVGYETESVNFIDWLNSERVLLETRLAYYKTIVDYMKSIAFLERIIGKDL
ncbi:MAG: TolC family protein [Candidatus Omnitrophica bacterium]|nr:TolC family protein [Candidatus Omnitrophota bacterium]